MRSPCPDAARLITFFGMIPNFEPQVILPRLAGLVRPADYLLFSANLAPGADYAAGVQRILPLYDNALTRDWLMTFLLDLGVEANDGELRFAVEDDPAGSGLKRVAAYFQFDPSAGDPGGCASGSCFLPASRFACSSPGGTRPRSCGRCSASTDCRCSTNGSRSRGRRVCSWCPAPSTSRLLLRTLHLPDFSLIPI